MALVVAVLLAGCASQRPPRAAVAARAAVLTPESAAACRHSVPVAACDGSPPRDVRDVLPIFEKRCFGCHTGEGVAAEEHDFSHLEALRAARGAIADEVATCSMPPRSPLDDSEATALLLWATCASSAR